MPVNPDYEELFAKLNAHRCKYLVVGAYAVMHYTEPRFTKDLDVWVEPSPRNANRVWSALLEYGAPLVGMSPSDLCKTEMVLQVGEVPNRVDIMMAVSGLRFSVAWRSRVRSRYGRTRISILGKRDLIRSKRRTGRPQDRLDIQNLQARR
ncbi:MAG: hypothetical protein FJ272_16830 [Planctomycetes bacterium]|nr:hypothetical protein [Planctomycetota bacterium]MBM4086451.1 hypothetical protein [Planctomycetota bacterium]